MALLDQRYTDGRLSFFKDVVNQAVVVITFAHLLFELGVLGLRFSIDGNIGVGIFPKVQEFFVRFAGGCVIAHQFLCPAELKPGQWAGDIFPAQTRVVDQFLELARRRSAIA
jgi:hypothetical protein